MNPQSRPTSTHEPAPLRHGGRTQADDERPQASGIHRPLPEGVRKSSRAAFSCDGEASQDLPTLAHILARYREHGTLARSVAVWDPSRSLSLPGAVSSQAVPATLPPQSRPPSTLSASRATTTPTPHPRPFAEVIEGLQTRELDGNDLFEQFFGTTPPTPPATR